MSTHPEVTLPGYAVDSIVAALERRAEQQATRGPLAGTAPAQTVADVIEVHLQRIGVIPTPAPVDQPA